MRLKPIILLGSHDRASSLYARTILRSSTIRILLTFVASYFLAYLYSSYTYVHDPTSYFFKPAEGFTRKYSLKREEQALTLIEAANHSNSVVEPASSPSICIGIATIARAEKQYVRSTVGSLLEGLTKEQRSTVHLSVFIAHTNPHVHPIVQEPWLRSVSNQVLSYNVTEPELAQIQSWEEGHHFRNKSMYDYAYLLKACYDIGAPWVAMVEDDVLARENWYPSAISALESIELRRGLSGWLYLRMFYTETLFGWNSEEWPHYLGVSLLVVVVSAISLIGIRSRAGRFQSQLSNPTIATICGICIPACIALYFMAGRVSMQPLSPGVHEMPKFGCCSQGFIFPRQIVPRVIERAHRAMNEDLYVDMMLEGWADSENLTRFALIPSLLQHIGSKSSKGWGYDEGAGTTWNFGFEQDAPSSTG
jgi:hypothetical protein